MLFLEKYRWEATHGTVIVGAITLLTLLTYLTGTPRGVPERSYASPDILKQLAAPPSQASAQPNSSAGTPSTAQSMAEPKPSDSHEVTVGASGISNRYKLLAIERKTASPTADELTLKLHVESLATDPLVSPFESDMLEVTSPELAPINPTRSFRTPIPAGNSRNQNITFRIPSSMKLEHATLRIRYYNYQGDIPLDLPTR